MRARAAPLLCGLVSSGCGDCDDIKEEAAALVAEYASCAEGDACQIVFPSDHLDRSTCLLAFGCFTALAADADLASFGRRARALEADFSDCGECAQAGCDDPERYVAECDVTAGRCVLHEAP